MTDAADVWVDVINRLRRSGRKGCQKDGTKDAFQVLHRCLGFVFCAKVQQKNEIGRMNTEKLNAESTNSTKEGLFESPSFVLLIAVRQA